MTANGITTAQPDHGPARRPGAAPGATTALVLLLFINMFNYIDRQVLAALEPEIEKTLFPAGGDPVVFGAAMPVEFWMGLLSTAFMVAFMLTAPLFGVLADRFSRWKLMGFGVAVWSLASGASGLAAGFVAMLATRAVVGVGEAAYGPAAPAVLSDLYPVEQRGRILSYFYVAIPVGSALGYVLGAVMGGLTHDWRWAFFVVVPPGLLLALICLFMREPPRGAADPLTRHHSAAWGDYLIILKTPSFLLCTLGYTATTFAVGGIAYWVPRYVSINRGEGSLFTVNMAFGAITVVAGLLSTLAGGWAGDALRKRFPGSYFLVSGAGMVLAMPLFLSVLITPFPWAYGLIFLSVFCLFFNTGPVNAIIANVTNPAVRASAFALVILIIHLFGDAFSPPAIGYVAGWARNTAAAAPRPSWWTDLLGSHGGMDFSFCVVSLAIGLAAILWLWGARYLERDTALAPTRGAAPTV
jgi:MFS transporter, Spinster family, sphingosine-1-phosphate transporter